MKTILMTCALVGLPLIAVAEDAKKAPAAGAPAVAPPRPKAPPPMPTPAKELEAAKGYVKNWTCTGIAGPNKDKSTAKMSIKKDLNNFWMTVRFEAKTGKMPVFIGQGYMGIDPVAKAWTFDGWDNFGGRLALKAATTAVTPEAMTFAGEAVDTMMGGKVPAKFMFTLDAKSKQVKFWSEFSGQPGFEYTCK
ncbi:MAG: hypothetical protein H0T46_35550 [Deltaproteobacteria bacterium]|nr:hypothetical protein [Deltaproteobacteria bacterium]